MLNRGFSLIELMVVVAIVLMLSSFAVPAYNDFMYKARIGKAIEAQSALNKKIIYDFQLNKWSCSTSTINFDNVTYNVGDGAVAVPSYSDSITGAIFAVNYGPWTCGSNFNGMTTIGATQIFVKDIPTDLGWEIVCLLGHDDAGVVKTICGVYDGNFAWQIAPRLLPQGANCILAVNQTTSGAPCE